MVYASFYTLDQHRQEYKALADAINVCVKRLDRGYRPDAYEEAALAEAAAVVFSDAEGPILDQFAESIRERDEEAERDAAEAREEQRREDRLNRSY